MPVIVTEKTKPEIKQQLNWLKAAHSRDAHNAILTEEISKKICDYIRKGAYLETACYALGLEPQRVYDWIRKGTRAQSLDTDSVYHIFAKAVKAAEAEKEISALNTLISLGEGGVLASEETVTHPNGSTTTRKTYAPARWQALAWYLERKYPQRFGKISRIEANINVKNMSDADLDSTIINMLTPIKHAMLYGSASKHTDTLDT